MALKILLIIILKYKIMSAHDSYYFSRQKYISCIRPTTINLSQSLLQRIVDGLQLSENIPDIIQQIQENLFDLLIKL